MNARVECVRERESARPLSLRIFSSLILLSQTHISYAIEFYYFSIHLGIWRQKYGFYSQNAFETIEHSMNTLVRLKVILSQELFIRKEC